MDELEKRLRKYGNSIIPSEETLSIMREAASLNIILPEDVQSVGPMTASSLIEKISQIRKRFLLEKNFQLDSEDLGTSFNSSSGTVGHRRDPHMVDKVLKAYFEFEKRSRVKTDRRRGLFRGVAWFTIAVSTFGLCVSLFYVQKPY